MIDGALIDPTWCLICAYRGSGLVVLDTRWLHGGPRHTNVLLTVLGVYSGVLRDG